MALAGACAASLVFWLRSHRFGSGARPRWTFDVKAFGASGLRSQNATGACQAAIDACTAAGGGTVRVPPGEYSVGMIQLKDNVTLHLDAGATLFLIQDNTQFPRGRRAMVFAENAANISVTGRGTLDGLAQYEFVAMRGVDPEIAQEIEIARAAGVDMRRYYRVGVQAYMFILNNCRNVLLRDISIVHSPLWNVRLNDCDRVHVHGVYIYSDLEKGVNADGIDIVSSRNVTISDSIIETGRRCDRPEVDRPRRSAGPADRERDRHQLRADLVVDGADDRNGNAKRTSGTSCSTTASSGTRTRASASTCRTAPSSATSSSAT